MSRTGHQPGLSGAVQKGMHDFGPPFAHSPQGRGRCSSDRQEPEGLGHVSLVGRVGPGVLKACSFLQYSTYVCMQKMCSFPLPSCVMT